MKFCLLLPALLIFSPWSFDLFAKDKREIQPHPGLSEDESQTVSIFRKASPSVAHITSVGLKQEIFSFNVSKVPKGTGTGFLWDLDGNIVTNFHVIKGSYELVVSFNEKENIKAKVIGVAPEKDLAVIQIKPSLIPRGVKPIPLGNSGTLQVGQKVLAIGNPFGLDHSLSQGIISALDREIDSVIRTPIKNVIQTDAAINPGNSGGPLLDSAGHLIGVNTAIYSPSGAYAGIGFAIPSETVNWVAAELIEHGEIIRPSLGLSLVSDRITWRLGLKGALILDVDPGSTADKAGLKETKQTRNGQIILGDLVTHINGKRVDSGSKLIAQVISYKVGDKVTLTIQRMNKSLDIPLVLQREKK